MGRAPTSAKKGALHPRNRHQGRYDFELLVLSCPDLSRKLTKNPHNGEATIDFADPESVRLLNRALLQHYYGVEYWEIPEHHLCPPVPGRSDYIHSVADLLAHENGNVIPRGAKIRVLDIGVGANCIYPIIGHCEYEWSFVGTDIDERSLASAQKIVDGNRALTGGIELVRQPAPPNVFAGLLPKLGEFDFTICNPPFHASPDEAEQGSRRKWRSLGVHQGASKEAPAPAANLNFGGYGAELWCPGGEFGFVRRMIDESTRVPDQALWFSTLVSKETSLDGMYRALEHADAQDCETLEMSQGQKKSRVVAWTFLDREQRDQWRERRWK